ncbi:hypothetical protein [uncultured Mameliella sp.]|uniref:hypothetical protein n=1 Tax=uncultured Mameliella sp. TaxID=1447087 RepID=UPI002609A4A7|nr:hypothetical protein [uncultured Mameliella sp.]
MPIDVDELKLLHADGWSDADMAVRFDVTAPTVKRWRETLRLKRNAQRRIWTEDEVARIRTMAAQGLTGAAIAAAMGENRHAVTSVARARGIKLGAARAAAREALNNRVAGMIEAGLSPSAIARELDVSAKAIRSRVQRLRATGRLPPVDVKCASVKAPLSTDPAKRAAAPAPRPIMRAVPTAPSRMDRREDRLGSLAARFGVEVVQAVAGIGRKGSYRRLSAVAEAHSLPVKSIEGIWHQVRAS